MKKDEIKDGQYVSNGENIYILQDVGNAIEKGTRTKGMQSNSEDELSYSIVDLLTKKVEEHICENSGMTKSLKVLSEDEVETHLLNLYSQYSEAISKADTMLFFVANAMDRLKKD